jgi:hypothetical protein
MGVFLPVHVLIRDRDPVQAQGDVLLPFLRDVDRGRAQLQNVLGPEAAFENLLEKGNINGGIAVGDGGEEGVQRCRTCGGNGGGDGGTGGRLDLTGIPESGDELGLVGCLLSKQGTLTGRLSG